MEKSDDPNSIALPKGISLTLIVFIFGAIIIFLTAGQSTHQPVQSTIVTVTQSVTPYLTDGIVDSNTESDVTDGLILAGALLILVILIGTVHATWGRKTPTQAH